MNKILIILGLLISNAWATITVSGTAGVCHSSTTTTNTVTRTQAAGHLVIAVVGMKSSTAVGSKVEDFGSGGSTFTRILTIAGVTDTLEIWSTTVTGSNVSTSVKLTMQTSAVSNDICVFEYIGVDSIGINATSTSVLANPSQALTTQDSNNWCVGGFTVSTNSAYTSGTGTIRASINTGSTIAFSAAFVDNGPIASPGTCTTSVTNAGVDHAMGIIELRSGAAASCSQSISLLGAGCKLVNDNDDDNPPEW